MSGFPQFAQYVGLALLVVLACSSRPVLWLGGKVADVLIRRQAGRRADDQVELTAAEVRALVKATKKITPDERALIEEVFAAGARPLREVLVPRTEVAFLDAELPVHEAARTAVATPHSRFPVFRDSHDEVIGFVHVRDLLDPAVVGRASPVGDLVRPVKFLPASMRVLAVLSEMRGEGHHLAIVLDEYGGTAGIVTLEDLVEELIGDIWDEYDVPDVQARRLHGGAVEVDGLLNLDAFATETGIELPAGPYETVAGHIMAALGQVPGMGDAVEARGHRLVVVQMDGRRVARVRVTPLPQELPQPEEMPEPTRISAEEPGLRQNTPARRDVPMDGSSPNETASDEA